MEEKKELAIGDRTVLVCSLYWGPLRSLYNNVDSYYIMNSERYVIIMFFFLSHPYPPSSSTSSSISIII